MGSRSRGGGYWARGCGCNSRLVSRRPGGAGELLSDTGAHRALWDADGEQGDRSGPGASSLGKDAGPGVLLAASGCRQGARLVCGPQAVCVHWRLQPLPVQGSRGGLGQVWSEKPGEGSTFTAEQQLSDEFLGVRGRVSSGRLGHWPEEGGMMSHLNGPSSGLGFSCCMPFSALMALCQNLGSRWTTHPFLTPWHMCPSYRQ